jgi:hypothetical protein
LLAAVKRRRSCVCRRRGKLDTIMGVRLGLGSLGHDLGDAIEAKRFRHG